MKKYVRIKHDRDYWINTETGKLVVNWRFEDSSVWANLVGVTLGTQALMVRPNTVEKKTCFGSREQ